MHFALGCLTLASALLITTTCAFCAQSESKSYTLRLTIPETVSQAVDTQTIPSKEQLFSEQKEIRAGQLVKVISIVVP